MTPRSHMTPIDHLIHLPHRIHNSPGSTWKIDIQTYLVEVDNRLPEVVALLVEVPHTDFSEVTRMVLIHIRSVMMLSTSETTSTGMLAVLSYTTMTGRDMSATVNLMLAGLSLINLFGSLLLRCSGRSNWGWKEFLIPHQRIIAKTPG